MEEFKDKEIIFREKGSEKGSKERGSKEGGSKEKGSRERGSMEKDKETVNISLSTSPVGGTYTMRGGELFIYKIIYKSYINHI